ncbi:hypothetical protein N8083_00890 [Candidatus Pacebacteria bacterium]|nr:hypothetical protein [Candidatus Paceibacterota bacterium]
MPTLQASKKFSLLPFIYINSVTLFLSFAFIKILSPSIWQMQLSASWQLLLGTFACVHLFNAFIEYFFHRYALHVDIIPVFKHFYEQHTLHHDHTRVERDGIYAYNTYPIIDPSQYEASFFPWYTLILFSVCFTPLFILIHLLAPSIPIFISGYTALFASVVLYELFHAAFHLPLSKWDRLFAQKYIGSFWKIVYMFHLRHHANIRCNESVSGFFGLPIPDVLFKTYIQSNTLFPHKRLVDAKEFTAPQKPIFFIR